MYLSQLNVLGTIVLFFQIGGKGLSKLFHWAESLIAAYTN